MKTSLFAVVVAAFAFAAQADLVEGPIIAQQDAEVSVRFVSQNAGWKGELSWLGTVENAGSPQFLFTNRASSSDPAATIGTVSAGESLFFQYRTVTGTLNTFRQDDAEGAKQFRHQWISSNTARLYIEDIEVPGGDKDFNDAVYDISFSPVPTPGVLGILSAGLGFLARRR
jgi:hypothetical protein